MKRAGNDRVMVMREKYEHIETKLYLENLLMDVEQKMRERISFESGQNQIQICAHWFIQAQYNVFVRVWESCFYKYSFTFTTFSHAALNLFTYIIIRKFAMETGCWLHCE